MGTPDQDTLDRLRGLVEAGRAGGWREVETALDIGDIVIGLRDGAGRGAVKAAEEATGMSHATLWRRVKLALHREHVEREPRPANLTEALRLVKELEAETEAEPKAKGGRPKKDPLEGLTKRLRGTVSSLALQALMAEDAVLAIVREIYAEARAVARRTLATAPAAGPAPETEAIVARAEAAIGRDVPPAPGDGFTTGTKAGPAGKPWSPGDPTGEPVTLIRSFTDGSGRALVVEKRLLGLTPDGGYRLLGKRPRRGNYSDDVRLGPGDALLRGHKLGLATHNRQGYADPPYPDLREAAAKARMCDVELLFDGLPSEPATEPKAGGSFKPETDAPPAEGTVKSSGAKRPRRPAAKAKPGFKRETKVTKGKAGPAHDRP